MQAIQISRWSWVHLMMFFLCLPESFASSENASLSPGMQNPGFHEKPSWFKLSFFDLQEDIAEASKANKRLMLYFYQDGCPYCEKLLRDNFGQREIAEKTQKHFDVLAINMWGDKEVTTVDGKDSIEKEFAKIMKVMFTPTLLFLDEKGEETLRINGYYFPEKFSAALDYVSQKKEKEMTFLEYVKKVSPVPSTGKIHQSDQYMKPPFRFSEKSRKSNKPLMVMFEQKACKPCDELHLDILKRKDTHAELSHFDVAVIDVHEEANVETPTGENIKLSDWLKQLDVKFVPTIVFFDTGAKEAFRTEAYLKEFHIRGAMQYVRTGAYKNQPSFQRFLQGVNEEMQSQGLKVDLMK